jgi:hypothetical protein
MLTCVFGASEIVVNKLNMVKKFLKFVYFTFKNIKNDVSNTKLICLVILTTIPKALVSITEIYILKL